MSSTTTTTNSTTSQKDEAQELFSTGMNLFKASGCHQPGTVLHGHLSLEQENALEQAVEYFAKALEIQCELFGKLGVETAKFYFQYGNALAANARQQIDSLLGAAVKKLASGEHVAQESLANINADPEDLEIGWECLEVARVIYQQAYQESIPSPASTQQDTEHHHKLAMALAQVHQSLGHLALELDKDDDAIEEFKKALALSEKHATAQVIAKAFEELAYAYQTCKQFEQAKTTIETAQKNQLNDGQKQRFDEKLKEIESQKQLHLQQKASTEAATTSTSAFAKPKSQAPVNDLTSLIKKRAREPPTTSTTTTTQGETKKQKVATTQSESKDSVATTQSESKDSVSKTKST